MSELNDYEKKLYQFLTQPDNFKGMMLVADQVEMVKRQLVIDFWEAFEKKLTVLFPENEMWTVQLQKETNDPFNWKMRVYLPSWLREGKMKISLGWEFENMRLFSGIIVNKNEPKHEKIWDGLIGIEAEWKSSFTEETSDTDWYPIWRWETLHIRAKEDWQKLLPASKESSVDLWASSIAGVRKEMAKSINPLVDSIYGQP